MFTVVPNVTGNKYDFIFITFFQVKEEETSTSSGGDGGVKKEGEDGKPFKPPTKEEISEMLKKTQEMIEARKK